MDNILIAAVQTPGEHILQVDRGGFVAVAAVVHTLGVLILACEQGIGNGVRTVGNGCFAQTQIEAHLMPQSVADLACGAKESIHLGVFLVGGQVEAVPVQNKIPVQIHIVFVIAAVMLHAVGIHIGHHQHTGIRGIQRGIDLLEEHIQHDASNVALHTVNTGGQDDEVGLLPGAGQIERIDVKAIRFINGITGDFHPKAFGQFPQVAANLFIAVIEGAAVGIGLRRFRLTDRMQDNAGADEGSQQHQRPKDAGDPQEFLFHKSVLRYFLIRIRRWVSPALWFYDNGKSRMCQCSIPCASDRMIPHGIRGGSKLKTFQPSR